MLRIRSEEFGHRVGAKYEEACFKCAWKANAVWNWPLAKPDFEHDRWLHVHFGTARPRGAAIKMKEKWSRSQEWSQLFKNKQQNICKNKHARNEINQEPHPHMKTQEKASKIVFMHKNILKESIHFRNNWFEYNLDVC